MKRRIRTLITALVLTALSCQMAFAASVTFTNFSYTTTPYAETLKQVAAKTKADNEQNWYVTLTASSGLTTSLGRAMLTSSTSDSSFDLRADLVPIYSTTTSMVEPYWTYTGANSNCKLYITGNQNYGTAYSVNISGRYTS